MTKKISLLAAAILIIDFIHLAEAQQTKKVPRIGFLSATPSINPAFLEGLHTLGYTEGENIIIEYRSAQDKLERHPDLAAELISLKVDIIVTQGTPAAQAAKKATSTIPIVMATSGEPVGSGLIASLARPGGNVTGLSLLATDVETKRLELLKETVMTVEAVEMRGPGDFESAFATAVRDRVHAAMVPSNSSLIPHRQEIVALGAKHRLPVAYGYGDFPEAGGLMSYGVSLPDLFRRAAVYVDKILKGAKPTELPVEQPKKFEFIINLKAAKQIGLTIPPNVLARADRVIK